MAVMVNKVHKYLLNCNEISQKRHGERQHIMSHFRSSIWQEMFREIKWKLSYGSTLNFIMSTNNKLCFWQKHSLVNEVNCKEETQLDMLWFG